MEVIVGIALVLSIMLIYAGIRIRTLANENAELRHENEKLKETLKRFINRSLGINE